MAHNASAYNERLPDIADGHEHWIRLFELDPGPSCPTTSTTDGVNVSGRLLMHTGGLSTIPGTFIFKGPASNIDIIRSWVTRNLSVQSVG